MEKTLHKEEIKNKRAESFIPAYEYKETQELVSLVEEAANLLQTKGESSFETFRESGKWRQKDIYIFILDQKGNMLVHPDPELDGKNTIDLKDVNGRPIIRGLIDAATSNPSKPEGWYHYQWPEPGDISPRWKSSFVKLVKSPSGKEFIVGSGMYNNRMEKSFVVDMVKDAVALIEKKGKAAFPIFHDETGSFMAKDAYIFVYDANGIEVVNPAQSNLEGQYLLDVKDTNNKPFVRDFYKLIQTKGEGWVNYMWPKPGESVSTEKSTYLMKAKFGEELFIVGCGVYLSDAPKTEHATSEITASKLMQLVREGATLLEKDGEKAFEEFRKKGSKWFSKETYFFVWDMDGTRRFHAATPSLEGVNGSNAKDAMDKPIGKMFLEVASSPSGEGWIHYMYPRPGKLFPEWKSTFVKRVNLPNGKKQLIGCGIYNMQMDEIIIKDVVNHAASLIKEKGKAAFPELRDKKGAFRFMDTYIFVNSIDGMELVNGGTPYMEGKNVTDLKDAKGTPMARNCIRSAMEKGSAWVDCYWYKPGNNYASLKKTFVRKVQFGLDTFIVGSGFYVEEEQRLLH